MVENGYSGLKGLSFKNQFLDLRSAAALALLGGLLQSASWSWPWAWFLSFFALVPLIRACVGQPPKRGFLLGFIYGMSLSVSALPWLADVLAGYGGLGNILGWLIFLLLCAFLALHQAVFGWLISITLKNSWLWVLLGACAWCGLDWIKNWIFTGFNWTPLAGPLVLNTILGQSADIFGFYALGFFVALINFCLTLCILNRKSGLKSLLPPLLITAALLVAAIIYGHQRYEQWTMATEKSPKLKIAVIQPSQPQEIKWDPSERDKILSGHSLLALQASQFKPWLIIWPETAMPFIWESDYEESQWLRLLSQMIDPPMLVGIAGLSGIWPDSKIHNRMQLINGGDALGYYDKRHLVPFGEYLPLDWLPFLRWTFMQGLIGQAGTYSPGEAASLIDVPLRPDEPAGKQVRLGLLICFESTFPYLGRERVLEGADILVVPTNDGWFGRSRAPMQHLWQAAMRAIETRRPIARVGNTGISASIDPSGTIGFQSELYDINAYELDIPLLSGTNKQNSFFVLYGYLIAPSMAALTCLLIVVRFFSRKRTKN